MTDAEKMREAAAQACDRIAGNTADFGRDYRRAAGQCAAMIRALPVEASAPAADCQQAGLVTVGAGLLDEVKAALREIIKTDRIYGVTFGSGEREVWHDGDSGVIARAALARLEREVG